MFTSSTKYKKVYCPSTLYVLHYQDTSTTSRSRQTGDRRQETGDRRQETGDTRHETGDTRQEVSVVIEAFLGELSCQMYSDLILNFASNEICK